jgi:OOP family OmpA-OmpF porin
MIKSSFISKSLVIPAFLTLFSCASGVQKVDLPAGSDPQPKIAETEKRLQADQTKQYNLLSPQHFKDAKTSLETAHEQSEKGESSDKILSSVGEAMAQLQIVEDNGQKNEAALSSVLQARSYAVNVKADLTVPAEFAAADDHLKSFGQDIENKDFHPEADKISKLEGQYSTLELNALKQNNLGEARSLIEKAEKNGAKNKAHETYTAAQVQYDSAARAIETNRRNPDAYKPAVDQSIQSAQKLDQVLKTMSDSKTSEVAAVQIYDQQQQLSANKASLQQANVETQQAQDRTQLAQDKIQSDHQNIQALQDKNQQYATREAQNNKVEAIKAEFSPAEADVVRDGNKIVIRLKTMKFSTDRYELTSSSMQTLQKVKEMIAAVDVSMVVVEGHTDSVGTADKNMELSQKRAESVKNYFVAEKTLPESKLEAKGYGYEHPLTTNKTKDGRAMNRRVDVIIETTPTAQL